MNKVHQCESSTKEKEERDQDPPMWQQEWVSLHFGDMFCGAILALHF